MVHSTTLIANAIVERRGVKTALSTTHGFRDVLEIGALGLAGPAPQQQELAAEAAAVAGGGV